MAEHTVITIDITVQIFPSQTLFVCIPSMEDTREPWSTRQFQTVLDLLRLRYQELIYGDIYSLAMNVSDSDDIANLQDIDFQDLYDVHQPEFPVPGNSVR